ncbi:Uncharacterized protein yae1 [Erysiphe neolycopersici]|uniref:Protein YAE1 n=1 Tax=Erysiphe neolycopersici TaxID=212602 RepID=A0A420HDE0_9PEZI|nr:Uncharacterized protein yae1 [Erysiphe neolycopersici]
MEKNTPLLGDAAGDDEQLTDCQDWSNDDLQDVFGSESSCSLNTMSGVFGNTECSDIPRLKTKHETEGYREGISIGKMRIVQKAFDEGFGLGAALGSHVGLVLGLLEGLARARDTDISESERLQKLLRMAEKELSLRSIFGTEWWEEQGIWKYKIIEAESEVTFHHVAKAHPLLKKWEGVVEEEVQKLHLELRIFENIDPDDNLFEGRNNFNEIEEKKLLSAKAANDDLALIRKDLHW